MKQKVLERDAGLRELEAKVKAARDAAEQEESRLRRWAEDILVKQQPKFAQRIQQLREFEKQALALKPKLQQGGQAADQARQELRKLQRDSETINRPMAQDFNKITANTPELQKAYAALNKRWRAAHDLAEELDAKLTEKLLQVSPDAKTLVDERKALRAQLMRPARSKRKTNARMFTKMLAKMNAIRNRINAIEAKLNPVRQKVIDEDAEVKQIIAQLQSLQKKLKEMVDRKVIEAAPELAPLIAERHKLDEDIAAAKHPMQTENKN